MLGVPADQTRVDPADCVTELGVSASVPMQTFLITLHHIFISFIYLI